MRVRLLAVLTVLAFVLVVAAACSGGDGSSATDGKSLVDEKCTACHTLDQVNMADYDAAGWESTVQRMIAKGAQISDEEAATIVDYLSTR